MVLAEHAEGGLGGCKAPDRSFTWKWIQADLRELAGCLGQHLNPLHLLKPFWLMISLFCCWSATEDNAKGLLSHCGSGAWQHSDQVWRWPTLAAASMTFFFGKLQLSPRVLDHQSACKASWDMLQLPARTGTWISRGAGVERKEGWGAAWCQLNGKWGHLTGSWLQVSCHLGSVPALPVKLLMNSITSLFFTNSRMALALLKSIVYHNAEQNWGA